MYGSNEQGFDPSDVRLKKRKVEGCEEWSVCFSLFAWESSVVCHDSCTDKKNVTWAQNTVEQNKRKSQFAQFKWNTMVNTRGCKTHYMERGITLERDAKDSLNTRVIQEVINSSLRRDHRSVVDSA